MYPKFCEIPAYENDSSSGKTTGWRMEEADATASDAGAFAATEALIEQTSQDLQRTFFAQHLRCCPPPAATAAASKAWILLAEEGSAS